MTVETRSCKACGGNGFKIRNAFSYEGRHYPEKRSDCLTCKGKGEMPAPDVKAIAAAIAGRKPGTLRSKRPDDSRAYFVWRMARFHGGADVTMPMTASFEIHGDPWFEELNAISEKIAKLVFGTDMAAAYRWSGLIGPDVQRPSGLPASAYPNGPVADEFKPEEEMLELR